MRATSQASLDAATQRWNTALAAAGTRAADFGEDLFAVADTLDASAALRRAVTEPNRDSDAKATLVTTVFDGKVAPEVLDLLAGLARSRWSAEVDLAEAIEQLGITALLAAAESRGALDALEEEVFHITRTLADNRDLRLALAERDRSAADRVGLLTSVFTGKVGPESLALAARAVSREGSITSGLLRVSGLAAERRRRVLAVATAAVPLTEGQIERLTDMLSRAYSRPVQLNIAVDPAVVGGLRIQVGDEVVDGTMLTRLDEARRRLAG